MAVNQPSWPQQWLMTDERIGERLWEAIDRLPPGRGGIVFRHYSLGSDDRAALGDRIAKAANARDLLLCVAGSVALAEKLGAALAHNPDVPAGLPTSVSVHNRVEAESARQRGAALAFISPVFGTRSHPQSSILGADQAALLARQLGCPAIALGGMSAGRFDALERSYPGRFHGFAGIDCWLNDRP